MTTLNIATKVNQAIIFPALLVANYAKTLDPNASINVNFEETDTLKSGKNASVEVAFGNNTFSYGFIHVIRSLVKAYPVLQGKNESVVCPNDLVSLIGWPLMMFQVDEWIGRTDLFVSADHKTVEGPLLELDAHLTLRSHIVGYSLSVADLSVWGAIRGNKIAYAAIKKGHLLNACRWFKFVDEMNLWIALAVQSANAQAQAKKAARSAEGGSYDIALPDVEKGVITRFPPEPS